MSATGRAVEAGTTLIEALAAVAILGLIGVIVFPQMERALVSLSLRETTAVVVESLREARADAVGGGRAVAFAASPDGRAYGWSGGAARGVPAGLGVTPSGGRAIVFYPDGSSSGGSVFIRGRGGGVPVIVEAATSVVRIGAGPG
ncbi:MAG: pilus assembly FimT family protein [Caulobacteraceae bacterium]